MPAPLSSHHSHETVTSIQHARPKTYSFNISNPMAEKKIKWAVILTALMMVAEIAGGYVFNSMALLADGWHMSTHAMALGLSMLAYVLARKLSQDARFTFGTWKIEILASFTSSILLILVSAWMLFQSTDRLLAPTPIRYDEAIFIAIIGLAVNLICAWLLKDNHSHGHGSSHDHGHGHDHASHHDHDLHGHASHGGNHDLNLRAAYIHVITDAATSVLAIIALIAGKLWGANWLDPVMGIIGGILVAIWSYGLIRDSGRILLDAEMDAPVVREVIEVIQHSPIPATINDIHVWRVGKDQYACVLNLCTDHIDANSDYFRKQLSIHEELVHIIVEVNQPLINNEQHLHPHA
ncbi:CDF family Co(II)/Ni(II) efflux transporter DmeF [Aquirhabdus sp.]|uniref:CDF family Co(II)/Ni(II) efflux transporter DmeF n=1 Tax=Aquirhabdus sp. TaxID=2824160 RepID=UPI00396CBA64